MSQGVRANYSGHLLNRHVIAGVYGRRLRRVMMLMIQRIRYVNCRLQRCPGCVGFTLLVASLQPLYVNSAFHVTEHFALVFRHRKRHDSIERMRFPIRVL